MENHPIPQDVTGFKFKLIGSVTIKQFLYLLGGGILAIIIFVLPFSAFLRLPLSLFVGAMGAALAFIPIEGRPMDVMIKNFLKALPTENQYIYRKRGAEVLISAFFTPTKTAIQLAPTDQPTNLESKRALLYKTLSSSAGYAPDENERTALGNITTYFDTPQTASVPRQMVDNVPADAPEEPVKEELKVVKPPVAPPQEEIVAKPAPVVQQPEKIEEIPVVPTPAPTPPPPGIIPNQTQTVTSVAPEAQLKAGFPQLPDSPNVVLGIVKDPRGRVIPNILVEIMDKQGVPVRAFKTNALGQFRAATALPNGDYTVVLEDQRKQNEFENINVTFDGSIFQPLEIVSTDQREKLRRELFGNPTQQTA